jgi:hypothetical protein
MTDTTNLPDPRLLTWTAKQTAAMLGTSLSAVKALTSAGELRAITIHGETRYLPDDVRAYVAGLRPAAPVSTFGPREVLGKQKAG